MVVSEELANIRSSIEALGMDFQFMGRIKTNMNGIEREIELLEYDHAQFGYVAGHEYYHEEIKYLQETYQSKIIEANGDGGFYY